MFEALHPRPAVLHALLDILHALPDALHILPAALHPPPDALHIHLALLGPLQATPLAVRWGHFLALAVVLGGAAALALGEAVPPRLAARYEGAFWVALAVLVLTGVGNAGALSPAVPGPGTGWGRLFAAKLVAVVGLVGFSLVRSGVVHELAGDDAPSRWWYAVTAGWTAAVVALAVVMVRG